MKPLRLKLVFFLYVLLPEAMPRPSGTNNDYYNKNVEDYLMQFGYLPKSTFAESMRTHNQIQNAVKNLQFFAGLNATGHIDDFTLDLMARYVHLYGAV